MKLCLGQGRDGAQRRRWRPQHRGKEEGHRRRRWIHGFSSSQPSDEDQARNRENQARVGAPGGDEACSSPGVRQGADAFPAGID